jgi:hypothetical protein
LELQSKQCDFYEPYEMSASISVGVSIKQGNTDSSVDITSNNIYMFALDQYNANDIYCLDMLKEAIASLQKNSRIILVVFGRAVNVFRLCGLAADSPVTADALPANSDKSQTLSHLLRQGIHIASAGFVVDHFDRIADALANIVPFSGRDNINRSVTNIRALVGLGIEAAKSSIPGLRLLIVSCRSFFIDAKTGSEMAAFAGLGRRAAINGCYIDVIHAGETACRFDWLDALCGATGGSVCEAPSFAEDHIRLSLIAAVQRPGFIGMSGTPWSGAHTPPFPRKGTVATLEVRTCPKLHVERVVGPVATEEEFAGLEPPITAVSNDIRGAVDRRGRFSKINSRAVDPRHVKYTLECTRRARGHAVTTTHITEEEDTVMKRLQQFNAENTVICGLTRCEADVTVTMQMKPLLENGEATLAERLIGISKNVFGTRSSKKQQGSSALSGQNSGASVPTVADAFRDSESGEAMGESSYAHTYSSFASSTISHDECAYVQTVVRFLSLDGSMTVTRVCTAQLRATDDVDEYLQGLDEKAWAVVMARGLVADYHDACIAKYGGARTSVLQGTAPRGKKGDEMNSENVIGAYRSMRRKSLTVVEGHHNNDRRQFKLLPLSLLLYLITHCAVICLSIYLCFPPTRSKTYVTMPAIPATSSSLTLLPTGAVLQLTTPTIVTMKWRLCGRHRPLHRLPQQRCVIARYYPWSVHCITYTKALSLMGPPW